MSAAPERSELEAARELARTALAALERGRARIDDLNVYPVPDGDTGTNMTLTVRAVVDDLERAAAAGRRALAREITRSALMGARGNSGVILSQIVRGFAEALADSERIDGLALAAAFRAGSDAAYRAVRRPVEGTMLTVIRELAEAAEEAELSRLPPAELLPALVRRGEESLAGTTEKLDVLREAGVVDAGGAGLVELVRGLAAGISGEAVPEAPPHEELGLDAIHQELSRYRYCTVFLVEGEQLDADALERELDALGDSLLVVGDASALKVHLHTDDPGAALAAGTAVGVLETVEIANMHRQAEEREERLLEAVPAENAISEVVTVVVGDGNTRLFHSLGATRIVTGGQTMNPSTADVLAAIEGAHAHDVLVLPNNPNVIMSAEQAARLASKRVEVLPTTSLPQGIAAMVAFDGARPADENAAEMREAMAGVTSAEVTVASRDAELDGVRVRAGEYLGLVEDRAVSSGPGFEEVAEAVCERLLADPREVLTLLVGEDAPELDGLVERLRERHPGLEIERQNGGQPHYPLLLGAE